jgi:hypothetical protein
VKGLDLAGKDWTKPKNLAEDKRPSLFCAAEIFVKNLIAEICFAWCRRFVQNNILPNFQTDVI